MAGGRAPLTRTSDRSDTTCEVWVERPPSRGQPPLCGSRSEGVAWRTSVMSRRDRSSGSAAAGHGAFGARGVQVLGGAPLRQQAIGLGIGAFLVVLPSGLVLLRMSLERRQIESLGRLMGGIKSDAPPSPPTRANGTELILAVAAGSAVRAVTLLISLGRRQRAAAGSRAAPSDAVRWLVGVSRYGGLCGASRRRQLCCPLQSASARLYLRTQRRVLEPSALSHRSRTRYKTGRRRRVCMCRVPEVGPQRWSRRRAWVAGCSRPSRG